MPYRIKDSDEDVQDAVRRIAAEQIGRAIGEIADNDLNFDARVHQLRKRCKKLRGLVRLVRPAFGDYSRENTAFRDAARQLSGVRDARTLITTHDTLVEKSAPETDRERFAPIRARLTQDAGEIRHEADTAVKMETVRRAMHDARKRAAGWSLDEKGFDAVAGGLRKTFRRARRRMDAAWADPTDAAMHDWRKRVKYHGYHARLLGPIHPQMMAPHQAAMGELSDLLGDHHDLAVLEARLSETPEEFGCRTDLDAYRRLLTGRKDALAERALDHGRLVLAERSKALVGRWSGYWDRWRSGKHDADRLVVKA